MNVVLDTNIIVTALLSPFGHSGQILSLFHSGGIRVCYDARVLWEYYEVLHRSKFPFSHADIAALLVQIRSTGLAVAAVPLITHLPDHDDDLFLEVALAGEVQCLVTGNLKDFPPSLACGIRVNSPRDFLQFYADSRIRKNP